MTKKKAEAAKAEIKTIDVRIPDKMLVELDRIAEKHHRSRNGETLAAVDAWIESHQKGDQRPE